jgi:hypothetical protein
MNKQIKYIDCYVKGLGLDRFFAAQDMVKSGLHENNNESL